EGLVGSSGGDVLHDVQLQLLLAGADTPDGRRPGADPGDDSEVDRSCVVTRGVAEATRCSTCVGDQGNFGTSKNTSLRGPRSRGADWHDRPPQAGIPPPPPPRPGFPRGTDSPQQRPRDPRLAWL